MTRRPQTSQPREVYFEVIPMGTSVKVVAVDSVTAREVTIIGPTSTPRKLLEETAMRKLQYVLAKS